MQGEGEFIPEILDQDVSVMSSATRAELTYYFKLFSETHLRPYVLFSHYPQLGCSVLHKIGICLLVTHWGEGVGGEGWGGGGAGWEMKVFRFIYFCQVMVKVLRLYFLSEFPFASVSKGVPLQRKPLT